MTTTHPTLGENRLPRNPLLSEVLSLVSKQKTKAKKIQILKENESLHLKSILIWNFDDSVQSILPEGEVPYNPNEVPVGTDHTSLRREYKQLYHFVKGGNDTLNATRREMMFINLLRGLHPKEAEVLILTKDKDLGTKYNITIDNVKQAFPNMTWG